MQFMCGGKLSISPPSPPKAILTIHKKVKHIITNIGIQSRCNTFVVPKYAASTKTFNEPH